MPLELAAIAFDGAFTAERELNNLRVSRLDPWVGEIAVLEHHHGGRYSMYSTRTTSPEYGGNGHAALPAARTGLDGAFLGMLGGLPGLLIGAVVGAIAGLAAGAIQSPQSTGAFGVVADQVRASLPADTSALMLIAESPAAEQFVTTVAPRAGQVIRHELSDELVKQLRLAATRKWRGCAPPWTR
jgi:uncharacterized membrane protein